MIYVSPAHNHNAFSCPPHVTGCECLDRSNMACNPYWVPDYCPLEIEEFDVHEAHGCDGSCK